jgi:hypothetical protein
VRPNLQAPERFEIESKEFIQCGPLGTELAFIGRALSGSAKDVENIANAGARGVEGVLSPINMHMVGNGFLSMNFFPNGRSFEECMSPFFLLDLNAEVISHRATFRKAWACIRTGAAGP